MAVTGGPSTPGNDTLTGDGANDTITSSGGADVIDGGGGRDTYQVGSTSTISIGGYEIRGDAGSQAGFTATTAGDVDADGLADFLIGGFSANGGGAASGEAYLFTAQDLAALDAADGSTDGIISVSSLSTSTSTGSYQFNGAGAGDFAGNSVSSAGDVDNDGKADLLIGSPFGDSGGSNSGTSYLLNADDLATLDAADGTIDRQIDLGLVSTTTTTGSYQFTGDSADDNTNNVSSAGDIDGDGLDDILIGGARGDSGGTDSGETYLLNAQDLAALDAADGSTDGVIDLGRVHTTNTTGSYRFKGDSNGDFSGSHVSAAGDVDGDGIGDFLIGAPQGDGGGANSGESYLISGANLAALDGADGNTNGDIDLGRVLSTSGANSSYKFIGEGAGDQAAFLSTAGDVDGDGKIDLLIAAPFNDTANGVRSGSTYLLNADDLATLDAADGTTDRQIDLGLVPTATNANDSYQFNGGSASDQAGLNVSSAGDVDGDGLDDILIGARGANGYDGAVYLINAQDFATLDAADGTTDRQIDLSNISGTTTVGSYEFAGGAASDQVGYASSGGDMDGDGFSDIIIGTNYADGGGSYSGETYLINARSLDALDAADGVVDNKIDLGNVAGATPPPTITPAVTVDINDDGDGTAVTGSDTDTLTSIENFVAGEASGTIDTITITDTGTGYTGADVSGLDDNSVGTFTPGNGDPVISFGPGQATQLSDLLALNNAGMFQITSGDETGTVGNISFENFETINFDVTGTSPNFTVSGTAGSDLIDANYTGDPEGDLVDANDNAAGNNDDVIEAGAGNDVVRAGAGDDSVDGGDGNDDLSGGAGNDLLEGDAGNDTLYGGAGSDTVFGGDGNDEIYSDGDSGPDDDDVYFGGAGNDLIYGGTGTDSLFGGDGNDELVAGVVDDYAPGAVEAAHLDGGAGNDALFGDELDDTLIGGTGADVLNGSTGSDTLLGGDGDDDIFVGDGDTAEGGSGDDVFALGRTGADVDVTLDGGSDGTDGNADDAANGDDGDTLDLSGAPAGVGVEVVLNANPEDGTVNGLDADAATDITFTEIENLVLTDDDDTVDGSAATVGFEADGGDGDDSLIGGSGDDTLIGGAGEDTIDGGAGDDVITLGDDGEPDTIVFSDGDGDDVLEGFDAPVLDTNGDPTTPNDVLDVSGLTDANGDPVDVNDVVVTDTNGDGTGDPILTFPNGESITLTGVDPAQFLDPATQDDALEAIGIPGLGPNFTVSGTAGSDLIDASYTGDPEGDLVDANDNAAGNNDDVIEAGAGNDVVRAGAGDDSVDGGDGNDDLSGGAGNDLLEGDAGNDTLYGGAGSDTVFGGDGNDEIYSDGDSGPDDDDVYFGGAGNDLIYGGTGTDSLFGGDGNDELVAGVVDDYAPGAVEAAHLDGGAGNDALFGDELDDTLIGGTGADVLNGSTGSDTLLGGDGDDDIFVGDGDTAEGGSGDDVFALGRTGADVDVTLDGGSDGTDGNADDAANGDDGDTLDLSGAPAGVGVEVVLNANPEDGTVNGLDADAATDITFTEIENLVLTDDDDTVDGSAATVGFEADGGDGDDSLIGGSGDDTLIGGAGEDTIDGGAGDDVITLGDDGEPDTIVFSDGDGDDVLEGFDAPVLDTNGDPTTPNDVLDVSGLTDANGDPVDVNDVVVTDTNGDGTGDPILTFPNGESITLTGVDPAQFLDPATQDDALEAIGIPGLGPNFTVSGTAGSDLIDASYTGDPEGDLVDANDNAAGNNDDIIEAGAGNDTVFAGAGNDSIDGGAGNDRLDAGDDDDTVYGGDGDDLILGAAGRDVIFGGGGNDTIVGGNDGGAYSATGDPGGSAPGADTLDGGAGDDLITGNNGDDLLIGGEGNDTLSGNANNDTLLGGVGDDDLYGGGGNDSIDGGTGNDTIDGGANNDTIDGGDGDDTIDGGNQNDSIDGGDGNDRLTGGSGVNTSTGGSGDDLFVFEAGETLTLTDFGFGSTNIDDNNQSNNDFVDLSDYYTNGDELRADLADDGVLNQSVGNFTDNTSLAGGTITGLDSLQGQTKTALFDQTNVPCFTRGTLIKTQAGEVLIEDLTVENLVQTMDCGYQPVRWIGSSKLDKVDLAMNPKLRPVCITAGALGEGMPATDLRVSPQHRVLVRSVISERMFDTTEVLIPAIKLIELDGIYQDQEATEVEYFHMLFDRHEIVFSNGAATESLFTGPEALKAISPEAREEISILFPEITAPDYTPTAARHIPEKGKLMKQLVARHAKNGKVMVQHIRPD